jgi:hypothetical protein
MWSVFRRTGTHVLAVPDDVILYTSAMTNRVLAELERFVR